MRYRRALRRLVAELAKEGVPLLAGTDTPNPYMVPGFSLHDELDALVRAGLTPREALAAATVTPGAVLPLPVKTGKVAAGYAADLVAVEGDPLEDLTWLRQPWAIMVGGRWLDRARLDELLRQVRTLREASSPTGA